MTKIVFYVVVFDQIGIQISWAHQIMRDINEVAKTMARNGLEIAKSSGCAFHFESEFIQEQLIPVEQNRLQRNVADVQSKVLHQ